MLIKQDVMSLCKVNFFEDSLRHVQIIKYESCTGTMTDENVILLACLIVLIFFERNNTRAV